MVHMKKLNKQKLKTLWILNLKNSHSSFFFLSIDWFGGFNMLSLIISGVVLWS